MAGEPIKTIQVTGPGGDIVINERDQEFYRSQGYKPTLEIKGAPAPAVETTKLDMTALEKMDVPSLKLHAEKMGIAGFEGMKKAELITAILEKQK